MTLYIKVTPAIFARTFEEDELRKGKFTYSGAEALLEFFESNEVDMLFDPISLACEWVEHEDAHALINEYGYLVDDQELDNDEEVMEALLDALKSETTVLETKTGGFVVAVS